MAFFHYSECACLPAGLLNWREISRFHQKNEQKNNNTQIQLKVCGSVIHPAGGSHTPKKNKNKCVRWRGPINDRERQKEFSGWCLESSGIVIIVSPRDDSLHGNRLNHTGNPGSGLPPSRSNRVGSGNHDRLFKVGRGSQLTQSSYSGSVCASIC